MPVANISSDQLMAMADPAGAQDWTPEEVKRVIVDKAQALRLDPALMLSLGQQESALDPNATSPTGVKGLFQVTQQTGSQYGQMPTARTDPRISTDAGMRYFRDLLKENKGNVQKALMQYNGGSDPDFDANVLKHYPGNAAGLEQTPANISLMRSTAAYLPKPVSSKKVLNVDDLVSMAGGRQAPPSPTMPNVDTLLQMATGKQAAPEPRPSGGIPSAAAATTVSTPTLSESDAGPTPSTDLDSVTAIPRVIGAGLIHGANLALGTPGSLLNLAKEGLGEIGSAFATVPWAPRKQIREDIVSGLPHAPTSEDFDAWTRQFLTKAGVDAHDLLDPRNGAERFAMGVIREATGAALPAGMLGSIARLAQVPARSIPAIAQFAKEGSVLDALANAPLPKLMGWQAMYGAGQGAGGEVGRVVGGELTGKEGETTGLIIGQLLGSMSPDAIRLAARLGKALPATMGRALNRPETVKSEVQQLINDTLLADREKGIANLEKAQAVQEAVPEARFSLGQAAGSEALLQTEQALARRSPGAMAAQEMQHAQEQRAFSEAAESRVGQVTQGAELGDTQTALRAQRAAEETRLAGAEEEARGIAERTVAKTARERETILGEQAQVTTQAQYEAQQARDVASRIRESGQRRVAMAQDRAIQEAKRLRQEGVSEGEIRVKSGETLRRVVQEERQKALLASKKDYAAIDPMDMVSGSLDTTYADLQRVATQAIEDGQPVPLAVRRTLKAIETRAVRQKANMGQFTPSAAEERVFTDSDLELKSFIRRKGGMKEDQELSGELRALISPKETGTTGLVNKNGLALDAMAQEAQQAGFIDTADKAELLDALRESQRTGTYYSKQNTRFDDVFGEAFEHPGIETTLQGQQLTPSDLANTPVTFMEMHALRSKLLRAQRETQDAGTLRVLGDTVDKIDRKMQVLAEDSGDVNLLTRYRTAQDNYKKNVVPFTQGPSREILQRQNGVYKIPNEDVVGRFWHTTGQGAQADAKAFTQLIGNREDAVEALTQYATNDLYMKTMTNGVLDLKKAEAWQRKHESLLTMFPEVRARFTSAHEMQRQVRDVEMAALKLDTEHLEGIATTEQAAAQAGRTEQAVQKAVQPGARPALLHGATVRTPEQEAALVAQQRLEPLAGQEQVAERNLEAVQHATAAQRKQLDQNATAVLLGNDYQQRLASLMGSRKVDRAQELLKIATAVKDDEQAGRGLLQGIWDAYEARLPKNITRLPQSDLPIHNPQQIRDFVNEYAPVLTQIGGPEFVKDLRSIAQGVEIGQRRATAGTQMDLAPQLTKVHAGDRVFRAGLPVTAGAIGAAVSGATGAAFGGLGMLAVNEAMRAWVLQGGEKRVKLVDEMLQAALSNPEITKTLAMMRQPNANPATIIPRVYLHYLSLGQGMPEQGGTP